MKKFLKSIISLNRYSKRSIAITNDIFLCILSTWLAFILRLDEFILFKDLNLNSIFLSIIIAIPVFWLFGVYRTIFRYTNLSILFNCSIPKAA